MEARINFSEEEFNRRDLRNFVNEGLQDVYNNRLLDFDEVFDELEKRFHTDE